VAPLFFTESKESQAAGMAFIERTELRTTGRNPRSGPEVVAAQVEAVGAWGVLREDSYDYLKVVGQPSLVVNGVDDIIVGSQGLQLFGFIRPFGTLGQGSDDHYCPQNSARWT
jgi:hypothetical protein